MKEAVYHFPLNGVPMEIRQVKSGHINETYLVTTDTGEKYVLQWINRFVFPNVDALMGNVSKISAFLRGRDEKMAMISFIDAIGGGSHYDDRCI